MFGKNITITNGEQENTIFVYGTPNMTDKEWEEGAKAIINNTMSIKS